MKFSYNWLQSFFKNSLPKPQELAELLTMRTFEVEEVTKRGSDHILDIDVLPNRAHDCLAHFGVAKEISALLNYKTQSPNYRQNIRHKAQNKKILEVSISEKNLCPRYAAYVIEGVKITESPEWIKERLISLGQKAINNVVDITNYVMLELGQPLHAFDFRKIEGARMSIRLSKRGEKIKTLDGVTHELLDDIIIEDKNRIIDLAGIKGGANTEIEDGATSIIFQAAIFDPAHIRMSTQELGLTTDAAARYIHGFDQTLPPQALARAMTLLYETSPTAKILQKIDIYPTPVKLKKISIDTRYVNSLLGTDISKKKMEQILEGLGFKLPSFRKSFSLKDLGGKFTVTVPSYRLDINIPEDVVEEIGRVYGYENIGASSPRGILVSPRLDKKIFWRIMTRQILSGFGFFETYNYSMIPRAQAADYTFSLLELENPMSDELRYLRPWLIQGILKNVSTNKKYFDLIKLFEIGKVFFVEDGDMLEEENLIIALSRKGQDESGFYEVKGYADELLKNLGLSDFYFDPAFSKDDEKYHGLLLHPERRAIIRIDNKFAGFIGEVHPALISEFGIKDRVYCAELNFDKVSAAAEEEHIYERPSKYPDVVRDIAILVPRDTRVQDVENVINAVSGPLLRDADLFDMFSAKGGPASGGEGGTWPEGMKSLAFHLLFQSDERTLTSEEVDDIMSKITKTLEEKLWEVR